MRSISGVITKRFLLIVLSALVLCAQHGAYLHVMSHGVQDGAQQVAERGDARLGRNDPHAPSGHEPCSDCLAHAAANVALSGVAPTLPGVFARQTNVVTFLSPVQRRTTTAYLSRAPPQILV